MRRASEAHRDNHPGVLQPVRKPPPIREATILMALPNRSASPRPSIREIHLQADAPDNPVDGALRRPRTTGRTTRPGSTLQSLDPAELPPAVLPTAPAVYSTRRVNGPAGTRPRERTSRIVTVPALSRSSNSMRETGSNSFTGAEIGCRDAGDFGAVPLADPAQRVQQGDHRIFAG